MPDSEILLGTILRQVVDLVPHQIFLKDCEGRFIIVNNAVAEAYNTTAEAMIGKKDIDFSRPEEAKQFMQDDHEVMTTGREKFIPEEFLMDKNGNLLILQTTKIPFSFEDTGKPGVLGIAIDITANKLAEKAIKESEYKYRMLMEQASDGIYLSDKDGVIVDANPKACELFGYSMEEFLGSNIKDLIDPKGTDIPLNLSEFKNKHSVILERRFIKKDGTSFTVELSARLLEDGRHQAILRDITERKKVEQILKDNERKFRALIENSSDIIFILGEDSKIKFVSPSVQRILGFSSASLNFKSFFEMIHPEDIDLVSKIISDTLSKPGENRTGYEIKFRNNTGGQVYTEAACVNLLDDPGINGIVINCHDITKRKNTEKELLNTNFELDSFVYKASHDLKAPLRSVMGLIKLARLESKDATQHVYLDMMNKSVQSLDTFIKDLTMFSRNSRMEVEPEKIDFEKVLNEALGNLEFLENAEKVKINKIIENPVNFYSDLTRVTAILNNLISNAFKYHRFENNNPYINIIIRTSHEQCFIQVEDNGSGIDPVHLERIFEMFYRASESSYGSGLGLYILKNAVTRLNGEVNVESFPDRGSKFTVRIPNLLNDI